MLRTATINELVHQARIVSPDDGEILVTRREFEDTILFSFNRDGVENIRISLQADYAQELVEAIVYVLPDPADDEHVIDEVQ